MNHRTRPLFSLRTAFAGLTFAFVLLSTSGCYFTYGLMGWAAEQVPQSKAVGLIQETDGQTKVIFRLKNCPGHVDGFHVLDIPRDWREQAVRPSKWGSDILELASTISPSLHPVAPGSASSPWRP